MSDYEKLRKLYDEIDDLIAKQVTTSSPEFITWHTKLDRFLWEKYGESSKAYKNFAERSFKLTAINPVMAAFLLTSPNSFAEACQRDLKITKAELLAYLERFKEAEEAKLKQNMPQEKSMPVVTFLIGNGFDLACGLKSRYSDTYEGYINSSSSSKAIEFFKKNIRSNIDKWADFEMAIAKYAQVLQDGQELIECVDDYQAYLNNYLKQQQTEFYKSCDYGNKRGKLMTGVMSFLLHFFDKGLTPNVTNTISKILETGFCRIFQCINFNYTKVFDELEEEAFAAILYHNHFPTDHYINKPIIHIHGKIDHDPILGVDNYSQFENLKYNLDDNQKRNVVKPEFLKKFDEDRKNNALSYIQLSNVIVTFGLSLGESDLTWKNAVAKWLKDDPQHHLIFFDHTLAVKNYSKINSNQKMNDAEVVRSKLIVSFFGEMIADDMLSQLNQQIHVPAGINFFDITKY